MKRDWKLMAWLCLRRRLYRDKRRKGLLRMRRWKMLKRK